MGSGELMQTRSSDFSWRSDSDVKIWKVRKMVPGKSVSFQAKKRPCIKVSRSKNHTPKNNGGKAQGGLGPLVFYFLFLSFLKFLQSNDNKRIEYIIKVHSVLSWMPPKTGASVPYTIASCTCGQRWLWAFVPKISLPEVPPTGLNSAFRVGCCFCCGGR